MENDENKSGESKEQFSKLLLATMPKEEIGALEFISKYPKYDGRQCLVGILDTGIDPGAEGLQENTDFSPKLLDIVDCTGDGDVSMDLVAEIQHVKESSIVDKSNEENRDIGDHMYPASPFGLHQFSTPKNIEKSINTVLEKEEEYCYVAKGFDGETLVFPGTLNFAGKSVRIGRKLAYEILPKALITRLKAERKAVMEKKQAALIATLESEIEKLEVVSKHFDSKGEPMPLDSVTFLTDLKNQLAAVKKLGNMDEDPGPVLICVSFFDGSHWRAAIGDNGDFRESKFLTNYRVERQYGRFGGRVMANYCLNVLDDGKLLSIVIDSSTHGTHVASIAGAHYPKQKEMNGVAPGCQIIVYKIGDVRLSAEETAASLIRAMEYARRDGCDVINLSFGESLVREAYGRVAEAANTLINKHGVIFVSSAGNSGPAVSSVGAPGGSVPSIISVGAYVTRDLMKSAYGMYKDMPGQQYHWSSRGPARNGDAGVTISAPGGAIAGVCKWTGQQVELMNGTSMASPNATGAVALLISALKQSKIPYSPHSVRRALENSAIRIPCGERIGEGNGLVHVPGAFELLLKGHKKTGELQSFLVSCPMRGSEVGMGNLKEGVARGIYIREPMESLSSTPVEVLVSITPKYLECEYNETLTGEIEKGTEDLTESTRLGSGPHLKYSSHFDKSDFTMKLFLKSESEWVKVCPFLVMGSSGRSVQVAVDVPFLSPGLHSTSIKVCDAEDPSRAPLLSIPITVTKPVSLDSPRIDLQDGKTGIGCLSPLESIHRSFLVAPSNATWATVNIKSGPMNSSQNLTLHTLFCTSNSPMPDCELRKPLSISSFGDITESFPVQSNTTVEIALARNWSTLGTINLSQVTVTFHCIAPVNSILQSPCGLGVPMSITLESGVGRESFSPSAVVTGVKLFLNPLKSKFRVLQQPRDSNILDSSSMHEVILLFGFQTSTPQDIVCEIPALHKWLYDAPVDLALWVLSENSGLILKWGEALYDYEAKLKKSGIYWVHLCLRHSRKSVLESLSKQLTLSVSSKSDAKAYKIEVFSNGPCAISSTITSIFAPSGPINTGTSVNQTLNSRERTLVWVNFSLDKTKILKPIRPLCIKGLDVQISPVLITGLLKTHAGMPSKIGHAINLVGPSVLGFSYEGSIDSALNKLSPFGRLSDTIITNNGDDEKEKDIPLTEAESIKKSIKENVKLNDGSDLNPGPPDFKNEYLSWFAQSSEKCQDMFVEAAAKLLDEEKTHTSSNKGPSDVFEELKAITNLTHIPVQLMQQNISLSVTDSLCTIVEKYLAEALRSHWFFRIDDYEVPFDAYTWIIHIEKTLIEKYREVPLKLVRSHHKVVMDMCLSGEYPDEVITEACRLAILFARLAKDNSVSLRIADNFGQSGHGTKDVTECMVIIASVWYTLIESIYIPEAIPRILVDEKDEKYKMSNLEDVSTVLLPAFKWEIPSHEHCLQHFCWAIESIVQQDQSSSPNVYRDDRIYPQANLDSMANRISNTGITGLYLSLLQSYFEFLKGKDGAALIRLSNVIEMDLNDYESVKSPITYNTNEKGAELASCLEPSEGDF